MPTTPPAPLPAPGPDQPAGPPIPDGFAPAAPSWRPAALLAVLAVVSVGGWWLLHRWYGLLENRNNTHFSFERIPGGFDSDTMRLTALILLVLAAAFWATILVLQRLEATPRQVALSVIAMAAGGAVVNVLLYPVGALDVFNYMVELKLAYHYGENPYLSTFAAYRESDPFALPAFLVEITLFYGPAWLLVMWAPMAFTGFSDVIDTLIALKVFNVALIALAGFLIARYQRDHRLRWLAAALFVANPLVLFEGVANGHNDVLLTVFVIGAMLALERRSPLAGPLLALSALVKLYTAALIPIFIVVALREHWGWRRIATTVALTAIAVVVTCAPYWGDGKLVDGLRAGLEESQEMDHVSLLSLAQQYEQEQVAKEHMDPTFARERPSVEIVPQETQDTLHRWFTVTFVALALLIAASVWRGRPPELAAAETLLLLYLLMTNLYPWYLITVFAVLALRPDRLGKLYIAIATALGLVYYPMFIFGHYNSGWTRFEIHQFLALFLTVPILLYLAARVVTWRRTVADASAREPWRPALPRWRVDLPGNPELPDRSR